MKSVQAKLGDFDKLLNILVSSSSNESDSIYLSRKVEE